MGDAWESLDIGTASLEVVGALQVCVCMSTVMIRDRDSIYRFCFGHCCEGDPGEYILGIPPLRSQCHSSFADNLVGLIISTSL